MASCPKRSCEYYHRYQVADCPYFRNEGCLYALDNMPKQRDSCKYGLSKRQQRALLQRQNGLCGICGCFMTRPQLDHDHKTGKARGYLCPSCNTKLTGFDDEQFRRDATAYLVNPPAL